VGWKPFSFDIVDLVTLDARIGGDSGLVYSTNPQKAIGADDESYVVKGPELEVVFAELSGCVLANAAGITVPTVRACRFADEVWAGSREVSGVRLVEPWLRRPRSAVNFPEVFAAVVVDVWLGNVDRNMGNIIGDPDGGDKVELVFIDFEKSVTLRPTPLIKSGMIDPRELWPSNELGRLLMSSRPLLPPEDTILRIMELDEVACSRLIQPVCDALGGVHWSENSIDVLARRARQIRSLTEGVWNS